MTKRMLIDATHSEETRVVVADGNQLLDYEYESAMRKQLRGNVFLAKVTRVEPSLQACFVNYGGNRHGFLPFSEIHPDYYRIPIADREALMEEQRVALEEARKREEEEDAELEALASQDKGKESAKSEQKQEKPKRGRKKKKVDEGEEVVSAENEDDSEDEPEEPIELGAGEKVDLDDDDDDSDSEEEEDSSEDDVDGNIAEATEDDSEAEKSDDDNNKSKGRGGQRFSRGRGGRGRYNNRGRGRGKGGKRMPYRNDRVEMLGGDSIDGDRPIRPNLTRRYKIQEVIKRGQIMLVQVSKEERGQKGAAVTSYLSLPGRYCVLMPNSPRSGGVSRKIANYKDRKRLRDILKEFNMPEGMSVIVRTAGVARTKTEIKRDLDYLLRLWDNIRTTTLESEAPAMIYEEGELVKRAIRDIYDRDMEEVLVEGKRGLKIAKDIMKMMIPSHVKRVKEYKDHKRSLFHAHKLEDQITNIGESSVPLKSGGSLVIHPTEALVSVDVNSGRATKERHIEETALRTNLEAAEEVARQLRLRDLGGLVVIDFIDMEDRRNNGKVERKIKEALSTDRARLQVGRISSFGLLELSRQRISASVTDTQFQRCAHCDGMSYTRTVDSMAILVLRALETMAIDGDAAHVAVTVSSEVALYILNQKRHKLTDIEQRYEIKIFIHGEDGTAPSFHEIETLKTRKQLLKEQSGEEDDVEEETSEDESAAEDKPKRGRGRGGRRNDNRQNNNNNNRRGGKGRDKSQNDVEDQSSDVQTADNSQDTKPADTDEKPKRGRGRKPKVADAVEKADVKEEAAEVDKSTQAKTEEPAEKPKRRGRPPKKKVEDAVIEQSAPSNDDKPTSVSETDEQIHARAAEVVNEAPKKKKKGWWNKLTE